MSSHVKIKEQYEKEVVPHLTKQFGYKNHLQVPRLEKVVINMGLGEAASNAKAIDSGVKDLVTVTGQKPIVNRARKSIATFKVRKGMPVGASVTLRGACTISSLSSFTSRCPESEISVVCPTNRLTDVETIPSVSKSS